MQHYDTPATINPVTLVAPAAPASASAFYNRRLQVETDCWDVHSTEAYADRGFVLLDVRSPALFAAGHLKGAVNVPHRTIAAEVVSRYPPQTLFVVYCAGPHCNAACKAAARLSDLGRPVKEMIGGITGWLDEGFSLVRDGEEGAP